VRLEPPPGPCQMQPLAPAPAVGQGQQGAAPQFAGAVQPAVGLLRRSRQGAQRRIVLARFEQTIPLASPAGLVTALGTRSPQTQPLPELAAPQPRVSAQSRPAAAQEVESKTSKVQREVLAQQVAGELHPGAAES
jgi:hypothetical protein